MSAKEDRLLFEIEALEVKEETHRKLTERTAYLVREMVEAKDSRGAARWHKAWSELVALHTPTGYHPLKKELIPIHVN